jgi:hypothetical protein
MTKLLIKQEEIEGLKNMVEELRMENCYRVADLICKEIARREEEKQEELANNV